jgi:hypothetical protein
MTPRGPGRRAIGVAAIALLSGLGTYAVVDDDRAAPPSVTTTDPLVLPAAAPRRPPEPPVARRRDEAGQAPQVRVRPARLAPAPRPVRQPRRLRIAALAIDMPVRPVGVAKDGQVGVPTNPRTAGWYRFGAAPGSGRGAAVLVGHVDDTTRLGPMARLAAARRGTTIRVGTDRGPVRYRVVRVVRVVKDRLDLERLFARSGPPRLHLVTCGGPFDPDRGYRDNVVVVAEPIPPRGR